MFPYGETVTVRRPLMRDRTGDRMPGDPAEHVIAGCGIDPSASRSDTDRRESVEADVTLYCPDGADIATGDEVILPDGTSCTVVGRPVAWRSPLTGWSPGVVAQLKAVI